MPNPNPKTTQLKPFVKGYDPRRAIGRVPKKTPGARALFRRIGAELLTIKERQANGEDVEYDLTRLEAAIRLKFSSKAPKDFETILKALYPGLLKDEVEHSGESKIELVVKYETNDKPSQSPPETD